MTAERYMSLEESGLMNLFSEINFFEMSGSFEEVDSSFKEALLFAKYVTELDKRYLQQAINSESFFNELKCIKDFFQRLSSKFFLGNLLFNLDEHDNNFLSSLRELFSRLSYLQTLVINELGRQSPQYQEIAQIITSTNSFISLTEAAQQHQATESMLI